MSWRHVVFGLACLAQIGMAVEGIWRAERTLGGTAYRFQTAPIDPIDAFRGRYVRLNFPAVRVPRGDDGALEVGETGWATLAEGEDGLARFEAVFADRPRGRDAVAVELLEVRSDTAQVRLGFDRFYLDEHRAPEVEARMQLGGERAIAVVRVRDGEGVLADLILEDAPGDARSLRERIGLAPGEVLPDALLTEIEKIGQPRLRLCGVSDLCTAFAVDLDPTVDPEWVFHGPNGVFHYLVGDAVPGTPDERIVFRWAGHLRLRSGSAQPTGAELRAHLAEPGGVAPVPAERMELRIGSVRLALP